MELKGRLVRQGDRADLLLDLGQILWSQGKLEEAGAVLDRCLKFTDTETAARTSYLRGLVAFSRGRPDEAAGSFEASLKENPGDVFARAGLASSREASAFGDQVDIAEPGKRVALHMNLRYHYGILAPVFEACRKRHRVLFTPYLRQLLEFDPHVVVVAESHASILRSFLPESLLVHVRHGLISKRTAAFGSRVADYICVTNEEMKEWYLNNGGIPRKGFWITGFSQMDPLFRGDSLPLPFPLTEGKPVVLYAPTWNHEFTSAGMLGARLVDLVRAGCPDCSIIIKPHPVLFQREPQWIETWRDLSHAHEGVFLVDDASADIAAYLLSADLLVSDASTVIFQYLACDRPIVLITNPERFSSPFYDPEGIEWKWRDVGVEIKNVEALPKAIRTSLADNDARRERRAFYRRKLFGNMTDGRAGKRIAGEIGRLFDKRD